jgi:membrane protease YdiL (CAAX protease family)
MKKEAKSRKHIICEKVPLIAMFLAAALALLVLSIPGLLGLSGAAEHLASSVLAILFMIAYTRWFAPEFRGVFKTSHIATGLVFVWLAFAFKFFGAYFVNVAGSGFYFKPTVAALGMAIAAGFYEETIFRGVTVPIGMRYIKSEKRVGILVLISALVFGLMHIGNIVNGASIQMGIAQGIATTFAGIFFIAAYPGLETY